MQVCKTCHQHLPLSEFHLRGSNTRRLVCKTCRQASRRSRKYSLGPGEYEALLEAQGGGCGICGDTDNLVVDHCHETGATRGILCNRCNRGIGLLGDDPYILQQAIDWLTTQ